MPKICMVVDVSGTMDDVRWPPRGTEVEVSDDQAEALVSGGLAKLVTRTEKTKTVEAAVEDESAERALIPRRPSGRTAAK